MATIDVLLPVKNGLQFFAAALDSICQQTYQDWRLLVLDHGSTDGSLELAHQYRQRDARIEVHALPEAKGLSGLLNLGLALCDCTYVMRHDADDVAFPDRMAITLAAFAAHPGSLLIGGQAEQIDALGQVTGQLTMPVGAARFRAASFFRSPFIHPTVTMNFAAIQQLGAGYGVDFMHAVAPEHSVHVHGLAEDYIFFGQLAMLGAVLNIPDKLIQYRWHGGNISTTKFNDQVETCLTISRFLARSFCAVQQQPYFDPAPFCNHGGILFDVAGRSDFSAEFAHMATVLQAGIGDSAQLQRELAYRRVISTRNRIQLAWRYAQFSKAHQPETGEWYAVRSWLLHGLPGKPYFTTHADWSAAHG